MDRSELEKVWRDRANVARSSMRGRAYVAIEQRMMSLETCARGLRTGLPAQSLIERWRQDAKQAKHALSIRGKLENPDHKARWEAMVEVFTQCAHELEEAG